MMRVLFNETTEIVVGEKQVETLKRLTTRTALNEAYLKAINEPYKLVANCSKCGSAKGTSAYINTFKMEEI